MGWREVPIDKTNVGDSARAAMPRFIQVFIEKDPSITDPMDFERKLYVIRKRAERVLVPMAEEKGGPIPKAFWIPISRITNASTPRTRM
ncbi:MAG: hypothetical protein ABFD04_17165 [Syntrophomonas sp.]